MNRRNRRILYHNGLAIHAAIHHQIGFHHPKKNHTLFRARFIKNAIQGQIRSMMNSTRQLIWIDIDCCWHLQVVVAAVVVVVVLEVAVVAAVL